MPTDRFLVSTPRKRSPRKKVEPEPQQSAIPNVFHSGLGTSVNQLQQGVQELAKAVTHAKSQMPDVKRQNTTTRRTAQREIGKFRHDTNQNLSKLLSILHRRDPLPKIVIPKLPMTSGGTLWYGDYPYGGLYQGTGEGGGKITIPYSTVNSAISEYSAPKTKLYSQEVPIHELGHYLQSPSVLGNKAQAEGGAEAFKFRMSPKLHLPPIVAPAYRKLMVRSLRRGPRWVTQGQFRRNT